MKDAITVPTPYPVIGSNTQFLYVKTEKNIYCAAADMVFLQDGYLLLGEAQQRYGVLIEMQGYDSPEQEMYDAHWWGARSGFCSFSPGMAVTVQELVTAPNWYARSEEEAKRLVAEVVKEHYRCNSVLPNLGWFNRKKREGLPIPVDGMEKAP